MSSFVTTRERDHSGRHERALLSAKEVEMTLEVVLFPVSDIARAKAVEGAPGRRLETEAAS